MTKQRLDNYNYMKIQIGLIKKIYLKRLCLAKTNEIHLPSNKEIACDFHCFYCQGSKLDMALGMDESTQVNGEVVPIHLSTTSMEELTQSHY